MERREQYLYEGPRGLGDTELVALILGAGASGRSSLAIAADLLEHVGGIGGLSRMEPRQWLGIPGLGEARAVRLHAAAELGRRSLAGRTLGAAVRTPEDAYGILGPPLRDLGEEELHGLFLDRRHRALAHRQLTRGSDGLTVVDPRQVFRVAVAVGASAVILAHNHPSGDPTPSEQDRLVTERMGEAGRVLGIPLLDHLVVGAGAWVAIGPPAGVEPTAPSWITEVTRPPCGRR